jgi:hypothetical protein
MLSYFLLPQNIKTYHCHFFQRESGFLCALQKFIIKVTKELSLLLLVRMMKRSISTCGKERTDQHQKP